LYCIIQGSNDDNYLRKGKKKMACMTHICGDCGNMWFDNQFANTCPDCQEHNVSNLFDEEPED